MYQSRAVVIEDNNAAIDQVSREKASSDPGSVGSPMVRDPLLGNTAKDFANQIQSGVVIDVRVKEGQDVKAGDPLCVLSAMKVCPTRLQWA